MLLTITASGPSATDLGYLLGKHPDKLQTFAITGGQAYVFYPEATSDRCTAALLLDIDTIDLVRTMKAPGNSFMLRHYINDRPYVASSLTASALSSVYGSALNGRCAPRPDLVAQSWWLEARLSVVRVTGNDDTLNRLFGPLGYTVTATRHTLDAHFPDWGPSPYYDLRLTHPAQTVQALLTHLYVLLPVLDNDRHFFITEQDVDILLRKGEGWLSTHPEKNLIVRQYLNRVGALANAALDQLLVVEEATDEPADAEGETDATDAVSLDAPPSDAPTETVAESRLPMHQQRLRAVLDILLASKATTVLDLGCGEGQLLRLLLAERQFERITGMDVAYRDLLRAKTRLRYDRLPATQQQRLTLFQGSLTYRDDRLAGFDAAALVEVIEHIDPERLRALERVVFQFARPQTVVVTTPNVEYNRKYGMADETLRHTDHRFEWSRAQFQTWGGSVASRFGYFVRFADVGEVDETLGASSQLAIFSVNKP